VAGPIRGRELSIPDDKIKRESRMRSTEDEDTNPLEHTRDVDSRSRVGDAVEIDTLSRTESAVDGLTAFDDELETLRPRILRLTLTISANNYLAAWSAKQDVARVLERVRQHLATIPEGSMQENAMTRVRGVLELAEQMIARAPSPSPDAIRQARSTDWTADRGIWEREEREWVARNASADPTIYVVKRTLRPAETELPGASGVAAADDPGASSRAGDDALSPWTPRRRWRRFWRRS
jgi:hypothetical protein